MTGGKRSSWVPVLVDVVRVGAGALPALKLRKDRHVAVRQDKAENVQVFPDAGLRTCLGDGNVPQLDMPPQNDLGGCPAMFGGKGNHRGVFQNVPAAQRAPRLRQDSQAVVFLPEF